MPFTFFSVTEAHLARTGLRRSENSGLFCKFVMLPLSALNQDITIFKGYQNYRDKLRSVFLQWQSFIDSMSQKSQEENTKEAMEFVNYATPGLTITSMRLTMGIFKLNEARYFTLFPIMQFPDTFEKKCCK